MKIYLDKSILGCGNEALWLLSERNAKKNSFLIAGGVLAGLLFVYIFIIANFCATEQSPLKRLLKIGSVRRRELWINMSFAVALVALNMLLIGGIQNKFKETFTTIMVVFGSFSLVCSFFGIHFVATRLIKPSSTVVHQATEFITGTVDAACTSKMFPSDRYQDFGNDLFGTVWLGIAQIILLSMYVVAVYADLSEETTYTAERRLQSSNETGVTETEINDTVVSEIEVSALEIEITEADLLTVRKNIYGPFYALALFVQIGYVFGKDTVKDKFRHILFWGKAYRAWWDKNVYEWKSRDASRINFIELIIRSLLSILINDVGLILLLLVLPLQLSAVNKRDCFDFSDKISDFVLNAVAIYYVVEVDNMEEKTYKIKKNKVDKNESVATPRTSADGEYTDEEQGGNNSGRAGKVDKAEDKFVFEELDVGRSVPV